MAPETTNQASDIQEVKPVVTGMSSVTAPIVAPAAPTPPLVVTSAPVVSDGLSPLTEEKRDALNNCTNCGLRNFTEDTCPRCAANGDKIQTGAQLKNHSVKG